VQLNAAPALLPTLAGFLAPDHGVLPPPLCLPRQNHAGGLLPHTHLPHANHAPHADADRERRVVPVGGSTVRLSSPSYAIIHGVVSIMAARSAHRLVDQAPARFPARRARDGARPVYVTSWLYTWEECVRVA
jgi:hypothetical protein